MTAKASEIPSKEKRITFCVWESTNPIITNKAPFFDAGEFIENLTGQHVALFLFEAPGGENVIYPFNKDMPKSAYLTDPITRGELTLCEGRGELPLYNEKVSRVDSYVCFGPVSGGPVPGILHRDFKAHTRSSHLEGGKLVFDWNPYFDAINEYVQYRGIRKERIPECIPIPVKTKTSDGLDYDKIIMWWMLVNKSTDIHYHFFTKNCSTGVLQALKAGGAERFLKYKDFTFATPKKIENYSSKLKEGLKHPTKQTPFDSLRAYVIKLVGIIGIKKSKPNVNELRINPSYRFDDFEKGLREIELQNNNELKSICDHLRKLMDTKFTQVKLFELEKVNNACALFLFEHPDTAAFNDIASLMVGIEKYKKQQRVTWLDHDGKNEALVKLMQYAESTDLKHGLFSREKKRNIVRKWFSDNPTELTSESIKLLQKLISKERTGDANQLIDNLLKVVIETEKEKIKNKPQK